MVRWPDDLTWHWRLTQLRQTHKHPRRSPLNKLGLANMFLPNAPHRSSYCSTLRFFRFSKPETVNAWLFPLLSWILNGGKMFSLEWPLTSSKAFRLSFLCVCLHCTSWWKADSTAPEQLVGRPKLPQRPRGSPQALTLQEEEVNPRWRSAPSSLSCNSSTTPPFLQTEWLAEATFEGFSFSNLPPALLCDVQRCFWSPF